MLNCPKWLGRWKARAYTQMRYLKLNTIWSKFSSIFLLGPGPGFIPRYAFWSVSILTLNEFDLTQLSSFDPVCLDSAEFHVYLPFCHHLTEFWLIKTHFITTVVIRLIRILLGQCAMLTSLVDMNCCFYLLDVKNRGGRTRAQRLPMAEKQQNHVLDFLNIAQF